MNVSTLNSASTIALSQSARLSSAQTSQSNDSIDEIIKQLNQFADDLPDRMMSPDDPNWQEELQKFTQIYDYLTANVDPIKDQLSPDAQASLAELEFYLNPNEGALHGITGWLIKSDLHTIVDSLAHPSAPEQKPISQRLIGAKL